MMLLKECCNTRSESECRVTVLKLANSGVWIAFAVKLTDHLAPVALPFLHKTLGIVHHPVVGACTDFSDSESLRQGENLSFRRVNHAMMGSSFCSRRKLLLNLPPRVFFS